MGLNLVVVVWGDTPMTGNCLSKVQGVMFRYPW